MSSKSAKDHCLFYCIAGSGMGNASRLEAVVEALQSSQIETSVHVFCWGRSYSYLKAQFSKAGSLKIHPLIPYVLPIRGGPLDSVVSIAFIPFLFFIYILNTIILFLYAIRWNPKISIHDSDYHYLPFMMFLKKRVAISQSAMVVRNRHLLRNQNVKTKINFFLFEYLEYAFTRLFATKIFCPSWDGFENRIEKKVQNIAPIVRKSFRGNSEKPTRTWGVFSGGSGIQTSVLEHIAKQLGADVYTYSPERGVYSIRGSDGHLLLSHYKAVVVQAGHVLISESLALGKIIFPVPIDNHPEQIVNSILIHRMFGRSEEWSVKDLHQADISDSFPAAASLVCDGAEIIVAQLCQWGDV